MILIIRGYVKKNGMPSLFLWLLHLLLAAAKPPLAGNG